MRPSLTLIQNGGRRRRTSLRRLRSMAQRIASKAVSALRMAWLVAFPPPNPNGAPTPGVATAALREGALLYEVDGEPVSRIRQA